ncbi:hypothetical protein BLA29_001102 [Euroglyphus maynei]|uniref:Sphingomyelin synthase-like domain-containing protein n=1 Tax=Euroglyphus maynei TaxID=6958 RepID=A0A1Y3BQK6_EURMA|nr:hypothetical protein BLA29_001102 [Euroglyphus maynei]
MSTGMLFNTLMIALTHERVPVQMKPLPDVGFDIIQRNDNLIIFSGHTIIIIMVHLFVDTYYYSLAMNTNGVKCAMLIMKIIHWMLSAIAIIGLIISHQHYTIDIIVSVYVCTQIFWTYHSLCMERKFFQQLKIHYHRHNGKLKTIIEHAFDDAIDSDRTNFIRYFWWWPLFVYFEIENQLPPPPPPTSSSSIMWNESMDE